MQIEIVNIPVIYYMVESIFSQNKSKEMHYILLRIHFKFHIVWGEAQRWSFHMNTQIFASYGIERNASLILIPVSNSTNLFFLFLFTCRYHAYWDVCKHSFCCLKNYSLVDKWMKYYIHEVRSCFCEYSFILKAYAPHKIYLQGRRKFKRMKLWNIVRFFLFFFMLFIAIFIIIVICDWLIMLDHFGYCENDVFNFLRQIYFFLRGGSNYLI
ncbi:transmembrane protein, putative (macronuclear) [Tetrahymena thermophila SB210]|uniref:Transmembrane protein, putative n=1 Tax=Tetrahymena thermophila (strain SB210) TaxID=312017 RepID=W7XHK6_TETTS|nr:transmembrane protein, putative [Tetrahymena thermophila SB210]EWS73871.1 transmembrane protein, putative [Tetrahymena thermophila SB210]|eukprot:XP_012653618.1 transmembrane protein, putative [Tetrahymena thermophila SB210]